jgi:hypothetical protein
MYLDALREGRGEAFIESLRAISLRLETDPRDFGEPLFELRKLRIQVRLASIFPLFVDYGVHWTEITVFVRGMRSLE